jgi:hypothetical protein
MYECTCRCPRLRCPTCCPSCPKSLDAVFGPAPRIDIRPLAVMLLLCCIAALLIFTALFTNTWLTMKADGAAAGFFMFRLEDEFAAAFPGKLSNTNVTGPLNLEIGTSRYCFNGVCTVKKHTSARDDYESESTCGRSGRSVKLIYEFSYAVGVVSVVSLLLAAVRCALDGNAIVTWRRDRRRAAAEDAIPATTAQQLPSTDKNNFDDVTVSKLHTQEEQLYEIPRSSRLTPLLLFIAFACAVASFFLYLFLHGSYLHCGLDTCEAALQRRVEELSDEARKLKFDCSLGYSYLLYGGGIIVLIAVVVMRLYYLCCASWVASNDLRRRARDYDLFYQAELQGSARRGSQTAQYSPRTLRELGADASTGAGWTLLLSREVELDEREARTAVVEAWSISAAALSMLGRKVSKGVRGAMLHHYFLKVVAMPQSEWMLAEMEERRHVEAKEFISFIARIVEPWRDYVEANGRPELAHSLSTVAVAGRAEPLYTGDSDAIRRRISRISAMAADDVELSPYSTEGEGEDGIAGVSPVSARGKSRSPGRHSPAGRGGRLQQLHSDRSESYTATRYRTFSFGGHSSDGGAGSEHTPPEGKLSEMDDETLVRNAYPRPLWLAHPSSENAGANRTPQRMSPQPQSQRGMTTPDRLARDPRAERPNRSGGRRRDVDNSSGGPNVSWNDRSDATERMNAVASAYLAKAYGNSARRSRTPPQEFYVFGNQNGPSTSRHRRRAEATQFLELQQARRKSRHDPVDTIALEMPSSGQSTPPQVHEGGRSLNGSYQSTAPSDGGARSSAFPRSGPDAGMRFWGANEVAKRLAALHSLTSRRTEYSDAVEL